MRRWILVLLAALTCALASEALARTWTSRSGRLKVEAEYVDTVGNSVRLRKTNGEVITWPLALLSDADRQYIKELPDVKVGPTVPDIQLPDAKADLEAESQLATIDDDSLKSMILSRQKTLRVTTLRAAGEATVRVGPNTVHALSQVVAQAFAEQETLAAQGTAAATGRLAACDKPEVRDQVLELPHAYLVERATRILVYDPQKMAQRSSVYRQYISAQQPARVSLAELKPESREGLKRFVQVQVPKLPATHPLRKSAETAGEQGVLQAIVDGKGEFEIVDTLVVPKATVAPLRGVQSIPVIRSGLISPNDLQPLTDPVFQPMLDQALPSVDGKPIAPAEIGQDSAPRGSFVGEGPHRFDQSFLAGFTQGHSWQWERRWDFPSGFFRITLGAGYGVGLRIPLQVGGTATPIWIILRGDRDEAFDFKTNLLLKTLDADPDFYRNSVGLPQNQLHEGHEIVLHVDASCGYRLRALWTNWAYRKYSSIASFNEDDDIKPPLGGAASTTRIEIPSRVTRTSIDLGIGRCEAVLGFHVGMSDGKANFALDQIYAGNEAQSSQRIRFSDPAEKVIAMRLPPQSEHGQVAYGFRLHDPKYEMSMRLTPQVKGNATIGYRWLSRTFSTGWLSLNWLAFDLGRLELSRHAGTPREYRWDEGAKCFWPPRTR